jgi:hypothetical protein
MQLRGGAMPDEPDGTGRPAPPRPPRPGYHAPPAAPEPAPAAPSDGPWRADRRLSVVKIVGTVLFCLAALLVSDRLGAAMLAVAALVCAGYALRDVVSPVRVAADAEGVTVAHGYLGHARLPWAQVQAVRVDRRSRLGLRSQQLEIDADERLYLFSAYDLSAEPAEVAAALRRIRTRG